MNSYLNQILKGDCRNLLQEIPGGSIDFIVTSPPYADNRKGTYGGIPIKRYVEWFLPISEQLKRVVKPDGSFILNIKDRRVKREVVSFFFYFVRWRRGWGWLR